MTDYPTMYLGCRSRDELRILAQSFGVSITERDTIDDPGPMEGEDIAILYWHDCYMNGDNGFQEFTDEVDGVNWYEITYPEEHDISGYPTPGFNATFVRLASDARGFWYLSFHTSLDPERDAQYSIDAENYAADEEE